jgi:hypothetical protein
MYCGKPQSTTWLTPQWLIDLIGISDLDPCGYKLNGEFVTQCGIDNYTLQDNQDGLKLPWHGSVYCNPPYDQNPIWLQKCRTYHEQTGNDVIVMLFNRSETRYFQEHVQHATGLLLVRGRVSFLNADGHAQSGANAASVLIAFGEGAFERIRNVPGIAVRILQ